MNTRVNMALVMALTFFVTGLRADMMSSHGSGKFGDPFISENDDSHAKVPGVDPPITYIEQAIASGTVGGTAFTNALLTVMLNGDTSTVTGSAGFFTNSVGTVTFSIPGVGSGT